jgi:hypothetical protein
VVETSGSVEFTDGARHRLAAQVGATLDPPFTIVTGEDGRAAVSHGQDRLNVSADSHVEVPQPAKAEKGLITRINQTLGSVLYQVEHRIQDSFEVDTPYLVSVVKGTTFNIHATPDDSTVTLIEGKLWVHTPDLKSEVILKPGQAAIKSRTGKGILVKDQEALSTLQRGPITVANDAGLMDDRDTGPAPTGGSLPGTVSSRTDQPSLLGGYAIQQDTGTAIPSTGTALSSQAALGLEGGVGGVSLSSKVGGTSLLETNAGVGNVSATATVGGGSALSLGASVGGVSVGASVGGGSLLDVGTSLGNVSATATVGGSSTLNLGANIGGASVDASVGGGSLLNAGTSLGGVSTAATVGGDTALNVGASVGGASTSASVGGGSLLNLGVNVGGTSTNLSVGGGSLLDIGSSTPATTTGSTGTATTAATSTATSPGITQIPVVGSVLGNVLKLGK